MSTNYYISKIDFFPRSIRREYSGTNVVETSLNVVRSCSLFESKKRHIVLIIRSKRCLIFLRRNVQIVHG